MANMSSQDQMPTGAMQETVATAETRDAENLGHVWRATSAKPVMESTGEKMPGEADMEPTEHPETMPGE